MILAELQESCPAKDDRRIMNFQHQGYLVSLGKNSFSNERLVAEHEHKECLWFHAMAARGSHAILCIHDRPAPATEVILYAAALALKHSHSEARTVHISLLRDVFKPEGAGIGIWKSSRATSIEVAEV